MTRPGTVLTGFRYQENDAKNYADDQASQQLVRNPGWIVRAMAWGVAEFHLLTGNSYEKWPGSDLGSLHVGKAGSCRRQPRLVISAENRGIQVLPCLEIVALRGIFESRFPQE